MLRERQRAHAPQHLSRYDDAAVLATRLQGSKAQKGSRQRWGERDVAGYRACLAGPVSRNVKCDAAASPRKEANQTQGSCLAVVFGV
jgi:hypothetical protein